MQPVSGNACFPAPPRLAPQVTDPAVRDRVRGLYDELQRVEHGMTEPAKRFGGDHDFRIQGRALKQFDRSAFGDGWVWGAGWGVAEDAGAPCGVGDMRQPGTSPACGCVRPWPQQHLAIRHIGDM